MNLTSTSLPPLPAGSDQPRTKKKGVERPFEFVQGLRSGSRVVKSGEFYYRASGKQGHKTYLRCRHIGQPHRCKGAGILDGRVMKFFVYSEHTCHLPLPEFDPQFCS